MRKIVYLLLSLPLLLSACKDGTEVENPSSEPITLLANIGSIGVETRGDGVINNDYANALSVNFARVNQTGGTAAEPTFPAYTDASVATLAATRGAGSNVINFASPQYYPTDATNKNTKMVGWYPRASMTVVGSGASAAANVVYALDGSTDVMLTNEVFGSSDAGSKFSDEAKKFTFAHQLTQLQFKVYAEDAAAATVWGTITSISVMNQQPTCTITLPSAVTFSGTAPANGVAAGPAATFPVTFPSQYTSAGAVVSGSVMIPPITAAAGRTVTLRVVTSKGTKDVTLDASAGMLKSNAYVYTLKFTKTGINIGTAQVANWITNNYDVDASTQVVNLSAAETANSYIARPNGTYKFKATVRGNGATTTGITPTAITLPANPSASVVWQTSSGLIIAPTVSADGYVTFSTNASTEGNAVIAVKDGNTTLWSWHIWVANYNPNATTYSYNNGTATNVFMDRNLGATTTTPVTVTTLGLHYQWGRKDPFPTSSVAYGNTEPTLYDGSNNQSYTITKIAVADAINLDKSIANPGIIYYNTSTPYDWYSNTTTQEDNLWGAAKTIYDPCPPGWRVPAFSGTASPFSTNASNWNGGYYFNNSYYPAAGLREGAGVLGLTGSGGYYWTASAGTIGARYLDIYNGSATTSSLRNRSSTLSVRCVKK